MSDFQERAAAYIDRLEELHAKDFRIQRDVEQSGYEFPLRVSYRNDDPRYLLGIRGSIGTDSLCSEYCFFTAWETLTADKLEEYFTACNTIRDELTEQRHPGHQFTMIGLVVCTEHFPKPLQRKLRRHTDIKRYKTDGTGWSEIRICVVDLADETIYPNADGESLKNRLTQGVPERHTGFFARLLGLD